MLQLRWQFDSVCSPVSFLPLTMSGYFSVFELGIMHLPTDFVFIFVFQNSMEGLSVSRLMRRIVPSLLGNREGRRPTSPEGNVASSSWVEISRIIIAVRIY